MNPTSTAATVGGATNDLAYAVCVDSPSGTPRAANIFVTVSPFYAVVVIQAR